MTAEPVTVERRIAARPGAVPSCLTDRERRLSWVGKNGEGTLLCLVQDLPVQARAPRERGWAHCVEWLAVRADGGDRAPTTGGRMWWSDPPPRQRGRRCRPS
ncbi:hypothetical protein ACWEQL_03705 [Kitasatospora sp. NPDC004240]